MKLKTNYFLNQMIELNVDSVVDYFKSAKYNYVIMMNGQPVHWIEGDGDAPIIYGDVEDYENELINNLDGYDEYGFLKDNFKVMTEFDFLMQYCMDAIIDWMVKQIKRENNFDGVCYIHYMNNIIKYNNGIILDAYVNPTTNKLSFLVSEDEDDMKQYFITINDLDKETILELIEDIFEDIN